MSGKKGRPQYQPKSFEKKLDEKKDNFAMIFRSMLQSEAWKDLTSAERILYVSMKAEYRGNGTHFTFNRMKWLKGANAATGSYELFGSPTTFTKARNALIDHGFIDVIEQNSHRKKANVYAFSSEWQVWKPP